MIVDPSGPVFSLIGNIRTIDELNKLTDSDVEKIFEGIYASDEWELEYSTFGFLDGLLHIYENDITISSLMNIKLSDFMYRYYRLQTARDVAACRYKKLKEQRIIGEAVDKCMTSGNKVQSDILTSLFKSGVESPDDLFKKMEDGCNRDDFNGALGALCVEGVLTQNWEGDKYKLGLCEQAKNTIKEKYLSAEPEI